MKRLPEPVTPVAEEDYWWYARFRPPWPALSGVFGYREVSIIRRELMRF